MSSKQLLHDTFNALLEAVRPENLIYRQCSYRDGTLHVLDESFDLGAFNKVHLFGSGKAVIPMAKAMQTLLGERIAESLLVGTYESDEALGNTRYIKSTHPLPSQQSITAAKALQQSLQSLDEGDFFIYLLSGGNSAMVELPEEGITLEAFQATTDLMLKGGMPIEAINSVRKHLSQVKGGKLALQTRARGIVLVLSDVLGDDLHAIGSAPLYFDTTSFDDAINALNGYGLLMQLPESVRTFLEEGKAGRRPETPKSEHPGIIHRLLGSNTLVLQTAKTLLDEAGIESSVMPQPILGDALLVADELLAFAQSHQQHRHCYLFGGEATVHVRGNGRGGRNQHLALAMLLGLDGESDITFLSAATDGVDGNSDAAGALIDTHSRVHAASLQIDPLHYLEQFDSYTFFSKTGELLKPGPTHNNLLDIVMILIEPTLQQGEIDG